VRIETAAHFLTWLTDNDRTLADATQYDVDAWIDGETTTRGLTCSGDATNGQYDANTPTGANKNDPGGDTTNAPKNESNNETNKSEATNGGSNAA
jgi:hypothetical protein